EPGIPGAGNGIAPIKEARDCKEQRKAGARHGHKKPPAQPETSPALAPGMVDAHGRDIEEDTPLIVPVADDVAAGRRIAHGSKIVKSARQNWGGVPCFRALRTKACRPSILNMFAGIVQSSLRCVPNSPHVQHTVKIREIVGPDRDAAPAQEALPPAAVPRRP